MLTSSAEPMRPERICKAISDALPADGVVVSDTGHAGMWSSTMIDLVSPGQRYVRCAGSLGWGLPGAIGVKCALPDQPVVCFAGDGGVHYHISELETAARHRVNIVLVINNNSGLNQELPLNDYAYKERPPGRMDEVWRFSTVDFARIAEGFGCLGMTVEKPAELGEALETALGAGRPAVINCISDPAALAQVAWEPGRV
jgi:acetolactate synthase-1/2/3 large subunit